jgi:hypothetical protein
MSRRIIMQQQIGYGATNQLTRNALPALVTTGWLGVVNDRILPYVRTHNIRRVLLNRVFGQVNTSWPNNPTRIEFDCYRHAEAGNCWNDINGDPIATQDLSFFVTDFPEAMRLLLREVDEVICYGGPPECYRRDLQASWDNDWDQSHWLGWLDLAYWAVQPILEAGCSLGMDATACSYPAGDYFLYAGENLPKIGTRELEFPYLFTRWCQNHGWKVYWEPWVQNDDYAGAGVNDDHCADIPRIALEPSFYPPSVGGARWKTYDDCKATVDELIRWQLFTGLDGSKGEFDTQMQTVLDAGDSAIVSQTYVAQGTKFDAQRFRNEYAQEIGEAAHLNPYASSLFRRPRLK